MFVLFLIILKYIYMYLELKNMCVFIIWIRLVLRFNPPPKFQVMCLCVSLLPHITIILIVQ